MRRGRVASRARAMSGGRAGQRRRTRPQELHGQGVERLQHLARVRVAAAHLGGQRAVQDRLELGLVAQVRGRVGQRRRRLHQAPAQQLGAGALGKGALPHQELVEQQPRAEDIAAGIRRHAAGLLGRHVRGRPHHGALARDGRRALFGVQELGQAEVQDGHVIVAIRERAHDDVRRLEVTVDDVQAVRVSQRGQHAAQDAQRAPEPRAALREQRGEVLARQVLHDHERALAVEPEVRDGHDVGVRERRERLGLTLEARTQGGRLGVLGQQHLDGHLPVQALVGGRIDAPETALPQDALHAIALVDQATERVVVDGVEQAGVGHAHDGQWTLDDSGEARGRTRQRGQGGVQLATILEALVGALGEGAREDGVHLGQHREGGTRHGQPGQRGHGVRAHQREAVLRVEGGRARQHLEDDDAHGVDVGARVCALPEALLGRHVQGCAQHRALAGERLGVGPALAVEEARQAEVEELGAQPATWNVFDEHVLGLDVAVHHALRVCMAEPRRDLDAQLECHLGGQRPLAQQRVQRAPGQQLRDQVRPLLVEAEVQHADDVGVLEPVQRPRLALEAGARLGVRAAVEVQPLEGHHLTVRQARGAQHGTLAPGAERCVQAVRAVDHFAVGGGCGGIRHAGAREASAYHAMIAGAGLRFGRRANAWRAAAGHRGRALATAAKATRARVGSGAQRSSLLWR
jgi:hypothetical protein